MGLTPGSPLTPWAPEQVASIQHALSDRRAAPQTRLATPPIHIYLTSMRILARWATHRLGLVLGVDGVDPANLYADSHQSHQVAPDHLTFAWLEEPAFQEGVDAMSEQDFSPIDVAHPRDHRLVHEQSAYGTSREANSVPCHRRVGIGSQRVGPKTALEIVHFARGEESARSRTSQFGPGSLGLEPPSDCVLASAGDSESEGSGKPEMHVDRVLGEREK